MHEIEMNIDRLKKAEETLLSWVEAELADGKKCVGAHMEQFGELIDTVKDLSEAKKDCWEAKYYQTICEAMKKEEEEDGPYGYDNWRYKSGRFAPKGSGTYRPSGYTTMPNMSGRVRIHDPNFTEDLKMGYHSAGVSDDHMYSDRGRIYDEYHDAKRHYTETGDMKRLSESLGDNLSEVIMRLREMSEDATPEMRKKLKKEVAECLDDIGKMM